MSISATRYHDISCGHRVVGHEGKCRHLHGHNYRIHFECRAEALDSLGRVVDFSVIKEKLCFWLEDNWDHKFLVWKDDPMIPLFAAMPLTQDVDTARQVAESFVVVPFNPTAENMADHLRLVVAPAQLAGLGVQVTQVVVEETRKCAAVSYEG